MTTEHLRKQFRNNFTLCHAAIRVARNLLAAGGSQNALRDVLEEISNAHSAVEWENENS